MREKRSLVREVSDLIRTHIQKQNLSVGDRLPSEADLIKDHQVSRTVLREAIKRLESIGLIQVRERQGMFVGDQDNLASCLEFARSAMAIAPRDLVDFGELRGALECWSARQAAERATFEQVAELEKLVEEMDPKFNDYEESIQCDFEFHHKLAEIANDSLISSFMKELQHIVLEVMLQNDPHPRSIDLSHELHASVVEAIRKGDPDAAEEAMWKHMEQSVELLEASARPGKPNQ